MEGNNPQSGDVDIRSVSKFIAGLVAGVIGAALLMWFLFDRYSASAIRSNPPAGATGSVGDSVVQGALDLAQARANRGLRPADGFARTLLPCLRGLPLRWKDSTLGGILWGSLTWDSVAWDSVAWDNYDWDSIAWDSVAWDSIAWDSIAWDSIAWDSVAWDSVAWDSIAWDSTTGRD